MDTKLKIGDLLEVDVTLLPSNNPIYELYIIVGSYVKESLTFWKLYEVKNKRIISTALEDSYLKRLTRKISL